MQSCTALLSFPRVSSVHLWVRRNDEEREDVHAFPKYLVHYGGKESGVFLPPPSPPRERATPQFRSHPARTRTRDVPRSIGWAAVLACLPAAFPTAGLTGSKREGGRATYSAILVKSESRHDNRARSVGAAKRSLACIGESRDDHLLHLGVVKKKQRGRNSIESKTKTPSSSSKSTAL